MKVMSYVVRKLHLEEIIPAAILDFSSYVVMWEGPDSIAVPPHIPGTWKADDLIPPPAPPEPTGMIPQLSIQKDQPLNFLFWTWQNGFMTSIPAMPFELRYEIFFELLGPGEAPASTTQNGNQAFFGGPTGPGHVYTYPMTLGGGGTELPLQDGSYKVYARFGLGANTLPHTPMAGMAEIGFLNVYTM